MLNLQIWLKGLLAAVIAGAANGVITGFAAVGIDPVHFNLRAGAGLGSTMAIAGISALMSALIGAAAYLKQSPLPMPQDAAAYAFADSAPGRPMPPDWRPPDAHPPDLRPEDRRSDHPERPNI